MSPALQLQSSSNRLNFSTDYPLKLRISLAKVSTATFNARTSMSRGGRGGGRGGRGGGRGGRPNVPWDTGDEPDARPSELFPVCSCSVYSVVFSRRKDCDSRCDTSLIQQTALPSPNPPRARQTRKSSRTTSSPPTAPDPRLSSIHIQAHST